MEAGNLTLALEKAPLSGGLIVNSDIGEEAGWFSVVGCSFDRTCQFVHSANGPVSRLRTPISLKEDTFSDRAVLDELAHVCLQDKRLREGRHPRSTYTHSHGPCINPRLSPLNPSGLSALFAAAAINQPTDSIGINQ